MIEARSVSKQFGSFVALDDVSVDVPAGSLTALLGPSGSGKSTLLRMIAGLETPDTGEIVISGEDATAASYSRRRVRPSFRGTTVVPPTTAQPVPVPMWQEIPSDPMGDSFEPTAVWAGTVAIVVESSNDLKPPNGRACRAGYSWRRS